MSDDITDDDYIKYAQELRLKWLKGEEELDMNLLKVSDSLTTTALTNKKIKSDTDGNVANLDIQKEMIAILKSQVIDPFVSTDHTQSSPTRLNVVIPTRTLNPDEGSVLASTLEYTGSLK